MFPSNKRHYLVEPDRSLAEAMQRIETNGHRSLIVVGPELMMVGSLSDGDIRKALLDGRLLQTPVHAVMNKRFVFAKQGGKDDPRTLFDRHRIFLLPVVDQQMRVTDIIEAY